MKCKNLKVFKQLLNKGVSPLCTNSDGMTAVHYAIELERFEYLVYLFEGEMRAEDSSAVIGTAESRAPDLYGVEEFMQKVSGVRFVWDSMHALD